MDVNKSTIQRYESGAIDNTKRLIVEGLANVLRVSPEWLRGETDEYESDTTDAKLMQVEDSIQRIFESYPLGISDADDTFSKNILLLLLKDFELFNASFKTAVTRFSEGNEKIAKITDFDSEKEYNEIMFLREITHTINTLNDVGDIIRLYSKNPEQARERAEHLLDYLLY